MALYDKKELVEISKHYFERNEGLQEIYATNDGNFFYEKTYATSHATNEKYLESFTILRSDAIKKKKVEKVEIEEVKEVEPIVEEVKEEVKEEEKEVVKEQPKKVIKKKPKNKRK